VGFTSGSFPSRIFPEMFHVFLICL
jgi:hypothetical protein